MKLFRQTKKMQFAKYDRVKTLVSKGAAQAGDVGTVVLAFDKPHEAYYVEILDDLGTPKALEIFLPNKLELIKRYDEPEESN